MVGHRAAQKVRPLFLALLPQAFDCRQCQLGAESGLLAFCRGFQSWVSCGHLLPDKIWANITQGCCWDPRQSGQAPGSGWICLGGDVRTVGWFSSSGPSAPHTQDRGRVGESPGRGLEGAWGFGERGCPWLVGAAGGNRRSLRPPWSDHPCLTAPIPGQDPQSLSLWPCRCLFQELSWNVTARFPGPQPSWAVWSSALSSPGGPGAGVV